MSAYPNLTRRQLEARLAAAENVVALYGWSPAQHDTDIQKATHEMYSAWLDVSGVRGRRDLPHLTDELITELAARRDRIRAETLARMRGDS